MGKEFCMKNVVKLLGIIAFVTIIGFSLAACGNVKLEGTTWVQSDGQDDMNIVFSSPQNATLADGSNKTQVTYTVSGNKVTITHPDFTGMSLTGTISGKVLTLNFGGEGKFQFTKQ
jgi:hypothetical protein